MPSARLGFTLNSDTATRSEAEVPGLITLFFAFAKMSLMGFGGVMVWARRAIVEQHKWMTAEQFNETFALCHFLPGPNIVNLSVVFGSKFRGIPGSIAAFLGLVLPPVLIVLCLAVLYARYGEIEALRRTLAGVVCATAGLFFATVVKMLQPIVKQRSLVALATVAVVFVAIGILRLPLPLVLIVAIPASIFIVYAHAKACRSMNPANQLFTLAWTFGLMSLFAVGGALSAIPEMHRVAVDVHHWMSDRQFADMVAIAQLSPGPNVLVVTLIGFHVAGVAGGLIATLAMCGPTAVVAYFVSRTMDRSRAAQWPSLIQSALVPLSIGLMGASAMILGLSAGTSWVAAVLVAATALVTLLTRLHPLLMLAVGGCLGFAGVI